MTIRSAMESSSAEAFGYYTQESVKGSIAVDPTDVKVRNVVQFLGYFPILGILMGLAHLGMAEESPFKRNRLALRIRALFEISGLGFLLLIPDLIVTLYRHCTLMPPHMSITVLHFYTEHLENYSGTKNTEAYRTALNNYREKLENFDKFDPNTELSFLEMIKARPNYSGQPQIAQVQQQNFIDGKIVPWAHQVNNSINQKVQAAKIAFDQLRRAAKELGITAVPNRVNRV